MGSLDPLALVLRRYAYAYTASHDFDVCDDIMVEDYVLRMNEFTITGRDEQYKPATQKQYAQYPGLGFTVHDFVCEGDRAALRFTEHGTSLRTGASASWRGISLYRWDGRRLTECRVEQDYFSRTAQQESGRAHPVPSPAMDPFSAPASAASAGVHQQARAWLETSTWWQSPGLVWDDGPDASRLGLVDPVTTVLDLFGAGDTAAFHVSVSGRYAGGLGTQHERLVGRPADLYVTGLVDLGGPVPSGHVVSDRLTCLRRIAAD